MTALRDYIRSHAAKPMVRPFALAGPILVLVISLPLLRPLRHPSEISQDELLRLATVRALVERGTLAIDLPRATPGLPGTVQRGEQVFSAQPPMMAMLLSVPAWVMVKSGLSFDENSLLIAYMLTVLGVTMPVAMACGLLYRMLRLFELRRSWRAGLSLAIVLGSGLISYAVVLNPHAPAATLVLASAAALIHVAVVDRARRRWIWLLLAGAAASLGATLDPPAALLALLFMFAIAAMRFSLFRRVGMCTLYLIGLSVPLPVHGRWNATITGDWLPTSIQASGRAAATGAAPVAPTDDLLEDEEPGTNSLWVTVLRPVTRLLRGLLGSHGLVSHFPVVIIGVAGVFAVMHRHWPPFTKILAAATLTGATTIVLLYGMIRVDWGDAMFAARWFVVFIPMLLFWIGAWLRRSHAPVIWVLAGVLTGFSVLVGLVGATGPYPVDGFRGYTPVAAVKRLLGAQPHAEPADALAGNTR